MRSSFLLFFASIASVAVAGATEPVEIAAHKRVDADAPEWRELAARFARQPDTVAQFEERRRFPFRRQPVVLRGEVRVSRERGLSLRYTEPDERIVILDQKGMLVRDPVGQSLPPDPRATAANRALQHILRLDLGALEKEFDVYGGREAETWWLVLAPRAEEVRRSIGNIHVSGEGVAVRTIQLRRSAKQQIDIAMEAPRSPVTFTAGELKRYFR